MGTGPFKFVEHVAGSHWKGERYKDYFKPDLPYLDGFHAIFTQGAALINALQGGQIMADFRSVTQVDRDRLVGALGNKITVQESPWLNSLLITFNAKKKPFDDARVRRALSLAVDRWKAAEVLPRSTIMRYVGAYVRPGFELAASDARPGEDAGLLQEHRGLARRGAAPAGGSRRAESQDQAHQPHHRQPVHRRRRLRHRPVAPDRRGDRAHPGQRRALQQRAERGHLRRRARRSRAIRSTSRPTSSPAICRSTCPPTRASTSTASSTACSSCRRTRPTRRSAAGCCAQFEMRMLTEAYNVPLLWWQRIVVMSAKVKGWEMSPSHLIGQDLEKVWLEPDAGQSWAAGGPASGLLLHQVLLALGAKDLPGLALEALCIRLLGALEQLGLWVWVAAFLDGAGGVGVEGVVCAMAALAQNEPTNAAMRSLRMEVSCIAAVSKASR